MDKSPYNLLTADILLWCILLVMIVHALFYSILLLSRVVFDAITHSTFYIPPTLTLVKTGQREVRTVRTITT